MDPNTKLESQSLELKGSHGTCVSSAENIKINGFNLSNGRRGYGAYFWAYHGQSREFANCLAKAWWHHAYNTKQFVTAPNPDCEVLHVKIKVEDEHFLDLDNHQMKLKLTTFITDIYRRATDAERKNLAGRAYDLFVQMIEKHSNAIKVINVSVNPPPRNCFLIVECRKTINLDAIVPACYVVRDKSCIELV